MKTRLLALLMVLTTFASAQVPNINLDNIEIVRDGFGIPHIFTKTDVEAAYALAWAQCEDNFRYMQEFAAVIKGRNGILKGKDGVATDFIAQLFQIDEFIEERFEKDISKEFLPILQAYAAGINRYAELHKEERLIKGIYPVTVKDLMKLYVFNFLMMNNSGIDIYKVFTNDMALYETLGNYMGAGSNAMAYSPKKTEDGKTYLVGNPHQPVDGATSLWEVSVHTEEGWDFWGSTFRAGGITPVMGSNKHLGWTHTTNYDDYSDVYELTMHPKKKNLYLYDGEWRELEKHVAKLRVKLGFLKIPVRKKFYTSVYGPVLSNDKGTFAFRNNAFMNIGAAEQWYNMNKATNHDEFWEAINAQQIPCQTITYADKEGNIFHVNNASFPVRNPNYEWRGLVPGDTSATLWPLDTITPITDIPHVINPESGYVYNCNNSAFECTGPAENPVCKQYCPTFGIMRSNTHRAKRFKHLISQHDKVGFDDIKAMRDDTKYLLEDINFRLIMNMEDAFKLDLNKYPDLEPCYELLEKWDGDNKRSDYHSAFLVLFTKHVEDYIRNKKAMYENTLPESEFVAAARYARDFLLEHYGTLYVPLGEVQKVVRENSKLALPMYGSAETLANCHVKDYKPGQVKMKHGDTWIFYAQYDSTGLESFKTVNVFGNSSDPESKHYTDQLAMFTNQEVKPIPLSKEVIYENAVRIYKPK